MESINKIFESHSEKEQKIFEKIATEIFEETKKESILIETELVENLPIFQSKFGWLPFVSKTGKIPESDGKQLFLFAQINCEELPENDFYPKKWILQFWVCWFDNYWFSRKAPLQNKNKILYFENLDNAMSFEEIKEKYKPYEKLFENEYALHFSKKFFSLSVNDVIWDFFEIFKKKFKKYFPGQQEINFDVLRKFAWLGYDYTSPHIQWGLISWNPPIDLDFRNWYFDRINWQLEFVRFKNRELEKYTELLLSVNPYAINKDFQYNYDIFWNFLFMTTKEKLKNLDFSEFFCTIDD